MVPRRELEMAEALLMEFYVTKGSFKAPQNLAQSMIFSPLCFTQSQESNRISLEVHFALLRMHVSVEQLVSAWDTHCNRTDPTIAAD